jgi:XTP/dITP diphosphohydrolase
VTTPRVVIATFNPGKLREIAPYFTGLGLEPISLPECGVETPFEETGSAYEEIARAKAVHYAAVAGVMAVADDSGVEVDALDGRPGVLSARYGGAGLDDVGRCRLMLRELQDVPEPRRTARYVAVAAIARPDGEARLFRGVCEGTILREMRGGEGFGYDPLFYFPPFDATFAEITKERKSGVSHRGRAFSEMRVFLGTVEGRRFAGVSRG